MHDPDSIPGVQALARHLSLDSLRLLAVVVRQGSMAAAARCEPLTASAISKRIAELERVMGHPLLERHREQLRPTTQGQLVLAQWRLIERELQPLAAPAAPRPWPAAEHVSAAPACP